MEISRYLKNYDLNVYEKYIREQRYKSGVQKFSSEKWKQILTEG